MAKQGEKKDERGRVERGRREERIEIGGKGKKGGIVTEAGKAGKEGKRKRSKEKREELEK